MLIINHSQGLAVLGALGTELENSIGPFYSQFCLDRYVTSGFFPLQEMS
jgi:hypothetical protein